MKCSPAVGAATDPFSLRKHRLVALAIRRRIVAMNVRRQRNMPDALQRSVKVLNRLEAQQSVSELSALDDLSLQLNRRPAGLGNTSISPIATLRPGRTSACQLVLRQPGSVSITSIRPVGFSFSRRSVRRANSRAGMTRLSFSTSRSPGCKSDGNSAKARVAQRRRCRAIHHQHAARSALRRRLLRNQLLRQLEIEIR